MSDLYHNTSLYLSNEEVISAIKEIKEISDYYGSVDLSEVYYDDIDTIIYRLEKCALSYRQALEKKLSDDNKQEKTESYIIPENPVRIEIKGKVIEIKTPMTFKRAGKKSNLNHNYILMNYVKVAIKEYSLSHNIDFSKIINEPYAMIMVRYSTKFSNRICDNDNLENSRIINEITSAMMISDNPKYMDLYSCFRIAERKEDIGMRFIIAPRCCISDLLAVI